MKLCIALDLPTIGENLFLAQQLQGENIAFKVGFKAFLDGGPQSVMRLKEMGFEVKKSQITLAEPIKEIGEFPIKVRFDHNLESEIRVIITQEEEKLD